MLASPAGYAKSEYRAKFIVTNFFHNYLYILTGPGYIARPANRQNPCQPLHHRGDTLEAK